LTYSWTPGGLNGATQNSLSAGTYTVSVTDQNNCSNSIQVTINEPPAIQVTEGTITPANCGVSDGAASVSASGGTGTLSYSWSPTGGNSAFATNISGGSYTVTVTDQNLCSSTLNIVVTTIGGPTVALNNQTNVSCFGGSDGSASVSASGGTAPYQYAWSPSGGTAASATGLIAGTYTVAVTDDVGCIGSASVTITSPTALSASANTTAADCGSSNGSITLNVSGGTSPYTYTWSPSGGAGSTASGLAPGTYTATITDALGCQTTTSSTIVTIGDLDILATPDLSVIEQGDTVVLSASGATFYNWSPTTGLSCTNCSSPTASPSQTTTYMVTGSDATGCTGTATVTIIVNEICGDIYVPTVFAPNSSSGNLENEKLCVYGNCISSLSYSVFDRWGNKVFETSDIGTCWDGSFKGKELNAGVFAYKLIVTLNNGDYIEQSGNVTLIR
jgi:gliding motility-associated-like protein